MTLLQRYVLHGIWLPLVLSFLTLNFIFMGGYLVKAANFIIGRGVPLSDTLYILLLALPQMVSYTIPMSLLVAVLIVFGNLSQNNEVRAMKASGIHPVHIMLPAFFMGLALSLMMFVFNDQISSNSNFELRRLTKQMLIKHPMAIIEQGRFVNLDDSVVFLAKEVNGNQMRDIIAYESGDPQKPVRTILAARGEIRSTDEHTKMQVRLFDGTISDSDDASVQSIQFKTYEFPTIGQEDIQKMRKKMRDLTLAELLVRQREKGLSVQDTREVWTAFHQRIAFAFGSFVFVFVGIPVAILVHRGEIVLSFGISMAATGLYYILFVGAKTLSVQGILPAMLAFWIPNALIIFLGIHLLRRAVKS